MVSTKGFGGRFGRPEWRMAEALALGALLLAAAGCANQQLEERNLALQQQLELALVQNADLQADLDTLEAEEEVPAEQVRPAPPPPPPEVDRIEPQVGERVPAGAAGEITVWTLPNPFQSGSADLKAAAMASLDKAVEMLKRDYPGRLIRVEGHTDSDPVTKPQSVRKWKDNWGLSSGRALTVVRYLASKGVDPKRICAGGFGSSRPVASNATAAGRAKNRRVEIVVLPARE